MVLDSKNDTLNFIKDYKNHEVLWNAKFRGYGDQNARSAAIRDLGNKYDIDGKAVKSKIKSLRTYFWREYRKLCGSASGGGHDEWTLNSTWFAFNDLLFLKDFSQSKDSDDKLQDAVDFENIMVDNDDDYEIGIELADEGDIKKSHSPPPFKFLTSGPYSCPSPAPTAATSMEPENEDRKPNIRKRRRSRNPLSDDSEDEAIHHSKHYTKNVKTSDEYSAFGDFISHKIRKLRTRHLRSLAQQQMCNIIFELEMSKENEDSS